MKSERTVVYNWQRIQLLKVLHIAIFQTLFAVEFYAVMWLKFLIILQNNQIFRRFKRQLQQ